MLYCTVVHRLSAKWGDCPRGVVRLAVSLNTATRPGFQHIISDLSNTSNTLSVCYTVSMKQKKIAGTVQASKKRGSSSYLPSKAWPYNTTPGTDSATALRFYTLITPDRKVTVNAQTPVISPAARVLRLICCCPVTAAAAGHPGATSCRWLMGDLEATYRKGIAATPTLRIHSTDSNPGSNLAVAADFLRQCR